MIRLRKHSFFDLLEYGIVIALILNGNAVWKYISGGLVASGKHNSNFAGFVAVWIMAAYVITSSFLKHKVFHIRRRSLSIWLSCVALMVGFLVLNTYNYKAFIMYFFSSIAVMIPFCCEMDFKHRWREFFCKYENVVIFLAAASTIMYFGGAVMQIIPYENVSIIRNGLTYTYKSYFSLLYTYQVENFFGMEFVRNCGIFLEGPAYAFPLSIAFFAELFARESISKTRVFVLLITIVTVFSSKAFIAVPIIVAFKLYQNPGKKKTIFGFYKYRWLIFPIILIVLAVSVYALLNSKSINGSSSYLARLEDTLVSLIVWRKNPLLGVGFNNDSSFAVYLTQTYNAITCGAIKILAHGGLYLGAIYYSGWFLMWKSAEKQDRYEMLALLTVLILFLFTSSTCYDHTFLLFIAGGFANVINVGKHNLRELSEVVNESERKHKS